MKIYWPVKEITKTLRYLYNKFYYDSDHWAWCYGAVHIKQPHMIILIIYIVNHQF